MMKQNVAAYLSYLFPQMYGFDMTKLEELGSRNIRAMIQILETQLKHGPYDVEQSERNFEKLSEEKIFNSMLALEVGMRLALRRMQFGNWKYVISQLKMLASKAPDLRPLMPSLRTEKHLYQGADVMVYTGSIDKKDLLPETKSWVCGKVFSYHEFAADRMAIIFTNNQISKNRNDFGGHCISVTGTSPMIFRRDEFEAVQELVSFYSQPVEFRKAFFNCCERSRQIDMLEQWNSEDEIEALIRNPSIEEVTDAVLEKSTPHLIREMVELTSSSPFYGRVAERIAKKMKIELE